MSHPYAAVPTSLQIAKDNPAPLYEQLAIQFRYLIAGGVLSAGERLPSVRSVSTSLLVNPITVAKAYTALEQEGLVAKQRGNGTFVADTVSDRLTMADRIDLLCPLMNQLANHAQVMGISDQDLLAGLQNRLDELATRNDKRKQTVTLG